jgi:hypothetical protein
VISDLHRRNACGVYGFCVVETQDLWFYLQRYVADCEVGRKCGFHIFFIFFLTVAQIAQFALISPRFKSVYEPVIATAPVDYAVFLYTQS